MNRWNYVKDLREFSNAGELLASYAKNTRRNVKIARNSGVEVRRLNRSELNVFHDICELSSERQHFANRSLDYFERVYDAFGDKAEFMVAEVHLDRYLQSWEEKLAKFSKDVERLERRLSIRSTRMMCARSSIRLRRMWSPHVAALRMRTSASLVMARWCRSP